MRHAAALALPAVLLAACASQQAQSPESGTTPNTVRVVGAVGAVDLRTSSTPNSAAATLASPPDSVWALLPAVYRELGLAFTTLDASRRLIGNSAFVVRRALNGVRLTTYLDCGSSQAGPNAATYDVTISISTWLTPVADGGTTVATTLGGVGRSPLFTNSEVACSSTRKLEDRIATLLRVKLQS